MKFPKLDGATAFPNPGNIDVFKYENDFDYSRYDETQMTVTLCSVPWDVGNVHVGNSIIPGLGNTVYFDKGEEARDKYLEALENKRTFTTKYRRFHNDDRLRIPVPFDVAVNYSYCIVDYSPAPGSAPYVEYESENTPIYRWLYFIRNVSKAPAVNTCELELMLDVWQTLIYRVEIPYMILEQGHAPVSKIDADAYLKNPIENTRWLMGEEEHEPRLDPSKTASVDDYILNDDCLLCIQSTGNPYTAEGWPDCIPVDEMYVNDAAPNYAVTAVEPLSASTFFDWIDANVPAFKQTITGVYIIPKKLLDYQEIATYCGMTPTVTVYTILGGKTATKDFTISKSNFGYASEYADLAKLYTWPYAVLHVSDGQSINYDIRIEDTTGKISLEARASLIGGAVSIVGHLNGVGGSSAKTLSFKRIGSLSTDVSGRWYDYLMEWGIDAYVVTQNPYGHGLYAHKYDWEQMQTAATNEKASADAQITATYNDGMENAELAYTNANLSATNITSNAALTVSGNSSINSTSNSAASTDTSLTNAYNTAINAWSIGYTNQTTNNEVNAEYASAAIGAAGGTVGSVISGAANGGVAGAIGGLIGGAISGATEIVQASVAANLTSSQASAANSYADAKLGETNQNASDRVANQISANSSNTTTTNSVTSGQAANNAATTRNQGSNQQTVGKDVAKRDFDAGVVANENAYNTAVSAISNQKSQRGLDMPPVFAQPNVNPRNITQPAICEMQVLTQNPGVIAMAGDDFLRHGYSYHGQWNFTTFNVMPKFSFWKCTDIWVRNLTVPDAMMDELRFLLLGGVTVWRKPEYIGNTTIYQNTED